VIQKATEKEVEKRYRDAKEFKEALGGAEKGKAQEKTIIEEKTTYEPKVSSPNINSVQQEYATTPQKKSNPIGIIAGVALVLGLGYLIWKGNKGTQIKETQTSTTQNESIGSTVIIGNQEWQAENLDVDRFRNGDEIPQVQTAAEWEQAGRERRPAWCYYENDVENGKIYGKLYNWYAVNDARGLAPKGWHIPTDEEWTILTNYLGGEEVAGGIMKSYDYWVTPNNGAPSEDDFFALPGGYRYNSGGFDYIRYRAFFWSATKYDYYKAWYRGLYDGGSYVGRFNDDYNSVGASVRCLRD
jgi:uncharacterized protein (TIGR02145 family)